MPETASTTTEISEAEIVERIHDAVIDQRLQPGTKLSEGDLCQAFGVGRMRIRRALLSLANLEVVELQANRGAFVAAPTPRQARDVFEARMALEITLAELACQRANAAAIRRLQKHVESESAAHNSGNRREAIRLSGQFHIELAAVANNEVMSQMVKNLIVRSSLIVGIFGRSAGHNCRDDEHAGLIQALRSKDGALAAQLMRQHLTHIYEGLDLESRPGASADLISLFKSG